MAEEAIPMWIEDSVLHIGAEATAISGSWMGREAVLKKREPRVSAPFFRPEINPDKDWLQRLGLLHDYKI